MEGGLFDQSTDIIVELQFGTGGKDSKLFLEDLLSAYIRYAEILNYKVELLEQSDGHATIKISGKGVWFSFQNEIGKHCIQRDPSGKKHTSVVSVGVLPLPPENKYRPLHESEIETKTQGGHGKGGQHQNATDSAVRMTHKKTGLQVFINGRCQHSNKREALRILTARVNEFYNEEKQKIYGEKRKQQLGDGDRSGKIRTYNYMTKTVVDHKLNKQSNQLKKVLKGRFDLLFE